ncbi:MAG: CDP-alcohol phosphatidyltransferase family protein [Caulobacteraceae bacterium]
MRGRKERKRAMKSSPASNRPLVPGAPGRPEEIESPTNRRLVHPLSRVLVDRLVHTRVTPNQVSVAGVFLAAAGAICYWRLPWPWAALVGLPFWFAWHVLDGADGDLARRTGRASTSGELVDGICDHLSQALLYVALALVLQRTTGGWAWVLAVAAGASHFLQSNVYETGRKTYRRWVYGTAWMRQGFSGKNPVQAALGGLYLAVSRLASPGEERLEAAAGPILAAGGDGERAMRARYRTMFAPLVKASGVLGGNARTIAAFLSMLAGRPGWFFLFEIVALNLVLVVAIVRRRRLEKTLLDSLGATAPQAASAPN